jgi:hypothetical protein
VTSKKKISDFEDGIFLLVSRLWPRRIVVGGGVGAGGNGQGSNQGSNPTESSKQGLIEGDMYGGGDRESEGEWMIKET